LVHRPRPLHLLPAPVEVAVTAAAPSADQDASGPPASFTCRGGAVHRLARGDGPERIAGAWWQGRDKTRDYFDVEDTDGRHFWLFRVAETGRWYMHGTFE
jgi:protein ImuB